MRKKDVYDTIRVFPATQQLKKYEANKKKAQNYVVQVDLCCMKYYWMKCFFHISVFITSNAFFFELHYQIVIEVGPLEPLILLTLARRKNRQKSQ